jgi:4-alpha-glucanotransferase
MVTTHDLPTIAGVWQNTDGSKEMATKLREVAPASSVVEIAVSLHREIAASDTALCLATLEDLAGCTERPNHPGTTNDTHPNWLQRMPTTSAAILDKETGCAITEAFVAARPN